MTPESATEVIAHATALTIKGTVRWTGTEWQRWDGCAWHADMQAVAEAITTALNDASTRPQPALREAAHLADPRAVIDQLAQHSAINTERTTTP